MLPQSQYRHKRLRRKERTRKRSILRYLSVTSWRAISEKRGYLILSLKMRICGSMLRAKYRQILHSSFHEWRVLKTNSPRLVRRSSRTRRLIQEQMEKIQKIAPTMKNNAGIKVTDINTVCAYTQAYLTAFQQCERYFWWAPWGNVSVHIPHSWDFIVNNFTGPKFDALTLDVFSHIQNDPWTLALKGKRILIISSFIESIQEKIDIREKIYGIDLFPDCEFVFLKPPQTHGSNDSREFNVEFADFVERVDDIKDTFDVALCSCGGYGNPICGAIYGMGKSAIYVGGVLQMYFGIYGDRWMRERPDVLRAYMNEHWSRPKETEKPSNHKQIENNCYW